METRATWHLHGAKTRERLAQFKSGTGIYAGRPPVEPKPEKPPRPARVPKPPSAAVLKLRFRSACDDAYLLERMGFDVERAWSLACLGNALNEGGVA
jgi:hypothetical protein